MACILKLPTKKSKGVISFTNLEYFYQIKGITRTEKIIKKIKDNWIVCYHPNWEDKNFQANSFFDAIISNKQSFKFNQKNKICKIPILDTASNRMSPFNFQIEKQKKWDFFHVSRYEPRKNIDGFLNVIKSVIKIKTNLSGVLLISVKPKKLKEVRKLYELNFTEKERNNFELITINYDLPFPLSRKILAHFYNASKVSLNTHLNEPHGRVVGYALASGLPVVGYRDLMQMVPENLRKEPIFFTGKNEEELSNLLIKSINYVEQKYDEEFHKKISNMYSEVEQSIFLKKELISNFYLDDNNWYLDNLDMRLSSHFDSIKSTNSHDQSVLSLLNYLSYKKKDFSFLFSKDDNLDIEHIVVNQINYIKVYLPIHLRILDYLICKGILYKFKSKIKIIFRKILPNFIIDIIKKLI